MGLISFRVLFPVACTMLTISSFSSLSNDQAMSPNLLGKIDFLNSGNPTAQPAFIEGVLYLHNFEYEQSAKAFRRAQRADPSFAMAYWGETMTHHKSIWEKQEQSEGQAVLQRLGATPEERAAMAPTPREKAYLGAVEVLFGTVEESEGRTRIEREILYREEMRRIHEEYPEDHEATSFYALSILGAGKTTRNFATYMRAAAVAMKVWDVNRMHPGAAHYIIHSFDDPVHAPLGLPMALAYSKIAPAAAHAQHMTSHIFLGLGMWDDVVTANETAYEIEIKNTDEWSREASHYVHWLHYGYLQQGHNQEAEALLEVAWKRLNKDTPARERGYYGTLYTRHLVESGDWGSAAKWVAPEGVGIPSPNYYFGRAFAAIKNGDLDAARESARLVQAGGAGNNEVIMKEDVADILRLELEAMFALAAGDQTKAVDLLREAAAREDALPPTFGPPAVVKPAAELLGDTLLELGRSREAVASYASQLLRTPRRAATLLGIVRSARASNDTVISNKTLRELTEVWHSADVRVREHLQK
jgi:tetratricopeptide (TPR) repeat protein